MKYATKTIAALTFVLCSTAFATNDNQSNTNVHNNVHNTNTNSRNNSNKNTNTNTSSANANASTAVRSSMIVVSTPTAVGVGGNGGQGGNAVGGNAQGGTGGNAAGGTSQVTNGDVVSSSTSNGGQGGVGNGLATNGDQSVNINNNTTTRYRAAANAPSIGVASGNDNCAGGVSAGIPAFAIGAYKSEANCVMLKNSRMLEEAGLIDAAMALRCMNEDVKLALEATNSYKCPDFDAIKRSKLNQDAVMKELYRG